MAAGEYEWRRDLRAGAVASTTERRLAMIWKVLIWAMLMIFVVSGAKADANKSPLTDALGAGDAASVEFTVVVVMFASGQRLFGLTLLPSVRLTRNDPEWEKSPPHVRKWFQSLTQPDDPRVSCCGEADAYEADLFERDGDHWVAIITGQGPGVASKPYIPEGTRISVPNSKMKWDQGNPTGHGIIFIGSRGEVYCYVTPALL
jgi:hypothetical protein